MEDFAYKSVAILGRQPALGMAEIESIYGPDGVARLDNAALLEVAAEEINFKRLGGVIKVGRVLTVLPTTNWHDLLKYLVENIPGHLENVEPGKFTLGLSAYGLPVRLNDINQGLLKIKKIIKASGRPVRIVPNKDLALNSAQVLHNKLTHRGGWELLFIKNGQSVILAQTLFVQDIDAYAARDQARPKRDARVGMLPPKLAQTLINLAAPKAAVLDPFCGTGVVLQEALLMGFSVQGSDIEPRMVEYTKANLGWLAQQYPFISDLGIQLTAGDATNTSWGDIDVVASEVFLGRPLASLPPPDKLKQITSDANLIIKKFLLNVSGQLAPGTRMCLAVPAWRRPNGGIIHLPLLAKLTDMGYNYLDLKHVARDELVYYRENQTVARQIIILTKV